MTHGSNLATPIGLYIVYNFFHAAVTELKQALYLAATGTLFSSESQKSLLSSPFQKEKKKKKKNKNLAILAFD